MMDSAPAQRRLKAINGHLISDGDDQSLLLRPHATAGEFVSGAFSPFFSLFFGNRIVVMWKLNFHFVLEKLGVVFWWWTWIFAPSVLELSRCTFAL